MCIRDRVLIIPMIAVIVKISNALSQKHPRIYKYSMIAFIGMLLACLLYTSDLAVLLGVTKSAISHQLKALRLATLVKFRKEAQIAYYSLADDHVKEIIDKGLEHLWQK